jgi:hypothetical protein
MRRLAVSVAVACVLVLPATVSAHPSENRNSNGFGGGPHCHFNLESANTSYAFPSHMAHAMQLALKPNGTVFQATTCPE